MVRRGRSGAVEKEAPGQRRLDESFSEDPEARAEREYRAVRGDREGAHPAPPYEERVAAWIQEREQAMRKRKDPLLDGTAARAAEAGKNGERGA